MNVTAFAIRTPRTNAYLQARISQPQIYHLDSTSSSGIKQVSERRSGIKVS